MTTTTVTLTKRATEVLRQDSPAVNFGRAEFLEIVHVERPSLIYRIEGTHFFFLAGLRVSTSECGEADFKETQLVVPWPPLEI